MLSGKAFSIIYCTKKDDLDGVLKLINNIDELEIDKPMRINETFFDPILSNNACFIHFAIFSAAHKVTEYCLSRVENDVFDGDKKSMLHFAAASGDLDMYQMIENKVPNRSVRDAKGDYPLHYAIAYGGVSILQYLWMNDVDINLMNSGRMSPLCLACYNGRKEVVEFYLNMDEDKELLEDRSHGLPPSFFINEPKHKDIFPLLTEHGFDLDHDKSGPGDTLLHFWVKKENFGMVQCIVKFITDFTVRDRNGFTAYEVAKNLFNTKLLKLMNDRMSKLKK